MKYGVNMMVWTTRVGEEHAPLFSRIKEWGFDGSSFFSPAEPANILAVRALLDRLQLGRTTCVVLPRDVHLVSREEGVRLGGINFLKRCRKVKKLERTEMA